MINMELPPGWAWATVEDVLEAAPRAITDGPFGSNLKSSHYTDEGARVLRLQNVGDGEFRDERAFISLEHFESLRKHEVIQGDLLIASLGEVLPRVALVPELEVPAIVKADVIRARVHESISSKWVLYALMSPQVRKYTASRIKGVGRPRLGLGEIRRIPIPVPPLAEQRRIVEALEDHLSRLDAASEAIRQARVRAAVLLPRIMSVFFPGAVDRVPLDEVAEVRLGRQRSPKNHSGDQMRPYLRAANVGWQGLKLDDVKEMNFTDSELEAYRLRENDIVLSEASGSPGEVGKPAIWRNEIRDCCFQNTLIRVRPIGVNPEYLLYFLRFEALRGAFREGARGVGIHHLGAAKLSGWKIPLPSLDEQKSVVQELDALTSALESAAGLLAREDGVVAMAGRLRKALIGRAFAGALVPQAPEEESASAMLERIRIEQSLASKGARGGGRRPRKKTGEAAPAQIPAPPVTATSIPRTAVQQEFEL